MHVGKVLRTEWCLVQSKRQIPSVLSQVPSKQGSRDLLRGGCHGKGSEGSRMG